MSTASSPEPARTPAEEGPGPDWTDQVTDLVVDSVDKVRAATTGRVMAVSRSSAYGLVAAVVAVPVVFLLLVGLVRLLNWAIPGDVWIAYAVLAGLLWLLGAVLWSRREPTTD
jgi:hypothetical protein